MPTARSARLIVDERRTNRVQFIIIKNFPALLEMLLELCAVAVSLRMRVNERGMSDLIWLR